MATAQQPLNLPFAWWQNLWPFRRTQALVPSAVSSAVSPAAPSTPAELLRMAVSQNADLAKLSQLMDLQERWERSEAKKAYVAGMNAFKANPPLITKNEIAEFVGKNGEIVEWEYSTLDHIHDAVISELSRHGISHRWIVEQPKPDTVRVTCVLTHKLGHSEQTTLEGPVDHSGSKNAIQAIGSSAKYLERYTLMAATGLADKSPDTDGLAGSPTKSNGGVAESLRKIEKAANIDQLRDVFKVAYSNAVTKDDKAAKAALIAAKDARLKVIR
jgi:ERF superfamily protein